MMCWRRRTSRIFNSDPRDILEDYGNVVEPELDDIDVGSDVAVESEDSDPAQEVLIAHRVNAPINLTPAEAAAASHTNFHGYVTCDAGQWAAKNPVGRLTVFPTLSPPADQRVQMRCLVHFSCITPVRPRERISNRTLLEWLFAAEFIPPDASVTAAERVRMRDRHMAAFRS